MKRAFLAICFVSLMLPISGCGEPTYDIPEIDAKESEQHSADMKAKMEAEMRNNMGGAQQ